MSPVIAEVVQVELVAAVHHERPERHAIVVSNVQILVHKETTLVESRMMVRAETEDIVKRVWPIVRRTQWADVGGFCIPPAFAVVRHQRP